MRIFGGTYFLQKASLCRKKSVAKRFFSKIRFSLKRVVPRDTTSFGNPWVSTHHDFGACEAMRSQQEAAEAEESQVSDAPVDVDPSALATVSEPSQVPTKGKTGEIVPRPKL